MKNEQDEPLILHLEKAVFEAFEDEKKDIEHRPYGPRWNEQSCRVGRRVVLSPGVGSRQRLTGTIVGFRTSEAVCKLPSWVARYGPDPRLVACIQIALT